MTKMEETKQGDGSFLIRVEENGRLILGGGGGRGCIVEDYSQEYIYIYLGGHVNGMFWGPFFFFWQDLTRSKMFEVSRRALIRCVDAVLLRITRRRTEAFAHTNEKAILYGSLASGRL